MKRNYLMIVSLFSVLAFPPVARSDDYNLSFRCDYYFATGNDGPGDVTRQDRWCTATATFTKGTDQRFQTIGCKVLAGQYGCTGNQIRLSPYARIDSTYTLTAVKATRQLGDYERSKGCAYIAYASRFVDMPEAAFTGSVGTAKVWVNHNYTCAVRPL